MIVIFLKETIGYAGVAIAKEMQTWGIDFVPRQQAGASRAARKLMAGSGRAGEGKQLEEAGRVLPRPMFCGS